MWRERAIFMVGLVVAALAWVLSPPFARADGGFEAFLEQRVVEELIADGVILSRLDVSLDVELVGEKAVVSLVDPATRRSLASTKIDALPADREAAVAQLVQVVAGLTVQLGQRAPAPPSPQSPTTRDDSDRRAAAELRYREEAIHFGRETSVYAIPTYPAPGAKNTVVPPPAVGVSNVLLIYQGDINRRITPEQLIRLSQRTDLVRQIDGARRRGTIVALTGAGLLLGGVPITLLAIERQSTTLTIVGVGAMAVGLALGIGGAASGNPENMFSEAVLYDIADDYNRKLRKRYKLDVSVTPYLGTDGGGVAAAGHF